MKIWWELPVACIVSIACGHGFASRVTEMHRHAHDFGDLEPGVTVTARFPLRNDSAAPVTLGGFEDACGVQVAATGNGILGAGEAGTLTLQSKSARRRGPGGAALI